MEGPDSKCHPRSRFRRRSVICHWEGARTIIASRSIAVCRKSTTRGRRYRSHRAKQLYRGINHHQRKPKNSYFKRIITNRNQAVSSCNRNLIKAIFLNREERLLSLYLSKKIDSPWVVAQRLTTCHHTAHRTLSTSPTSSTRTAKSNLTINTSTTPNSSTTIINTPRT